MELDARMRTVTKPMSEPLHSPFVEYYQVAQALGVHWQIRHRRVISQNDDKMHISVSSGWLLPSCRADTATTVELGLSIR